MNDFDQIMANANSNTTKSNKSFDKNAWRERKQQERQEVYDLMDKTADEIKTDINKYKQYLDVQGRFDKYSVGNALVISATYPNATQIKEFDDWKESGAFIKKGANGIKILEPGDSYTRSDGSSAISYNYGSSSCGGGVCLDGGILNIGESCDVAAEIYANNGNSRAGAIYAAGGTINLYGSIHHNYSADGAAGIFLCGSTVNMY